MTKTVLTILALIAIIIIAPLAAIWSINTLFATTIPYTIYTWIAALILGASIRSK